MTVNWNNIFEYTNLTTFIEKKELITFVNFDDIDISETKSIFNNILEFNEKDDDNCQNCNIEMHNISNIILECSNCGLQKKKSIISRNKMIRNYNVATSSFLSIKIVGKNSYFFQKSLLKVCSNYKKYSYNNNLKEITILLNKSGKSKIPKEIKKHGVKIYTKVKKATFRGDSRKGLIAACLHLACSINNISKPISYFCDIFNISERHFSKGYMIILDLIERQEVNLNIKFDEIKDFIKRYLKLLNMDEELYLNDIRYIINIAEKYNLHLICNSRNVTKCCGALMFIITLDKRLHHLNQKIISEKCNISVNTFKKYYKILLKYNKYYEFLYKKYNAKVELKKKKYKIVYK